MTTWASLGEKIKELEFEVDDLEAIECDQAKTIKALSREVAILREYERAILLLADAWGALCAIFGDSPS